MTDLVKCVRSSLSSNTGGLCNGFGKFEQRKMNAGIWSIQGFITIRPRFLPPSVSQCYPNLTTAWNSNGFILQLSKFPTANLLGFNLWGQGTGDTKMHAPKNRNSPGTLLEPFAVGLQSWANYHYILASTGSNEAHLATAWSTSLGQIHIDRLGNPSASPSTFL